MSEPENTETAQSWDTYWQGTGDVAAFGAGGVAHPAIAAFWREYFTALSGEQRPIHLLDVATGNGALLELAASILDAEATTMSCVDISQAAIDNVAQRYPNITGHVADAVSLPMDSEQYDAVISQFGVEYAGLDAVAEAGRMVAPGGQLVLMLHIVDGIVHRECQASLAAIERLQAANFIPLAMDFFKQGFAAVQGADRRAYDDAGTQLSPAVQEAEAIMQEFGEGVAGNTIASLYADVGRIHSKLPQYDANDVQTWLETHQRELIAYAERMTSMAKAAISAEQFQAVAEQLRSNGFTLEQAAALSAQGEDVPLAWILAATR